MQLNRKNIPKIISYAALIITVIALYVLLTLASANKPSKLRNTSSIDEEINIGGDFKLTDMNGNIFNSKELNGKLSLIYFGFTFCPDICPTSLNKISQILNNLEKYNIPVNSIFITVDPVRDTKELLKLYLGSFHRNIIGLTGNEQEIKDAADKFKVYYAIAKNKPSDPSNYMIDHTSFIYILDKNGKYLKHFYMSSTAQEIVEFIRLNR